MNEAKLFAAGVTASLVPVLAAVPEAGAGTVYTRSDLVAPAPTSRFLALVHQELHRPPQALLTWGSFTLPAGPHSVDVDVESPPNFDSYCLVGLDATGGVFVSFADPSIALGRSFSSIFPGMSEPEVAQAIESGGPLFDEFMARLDTTPGVATPMGMRSETVHFSDGAYYGTFIADFSPVPAPGAVVMFVLAGPLGFVRRRR